MIRTDPTLRSADRKAGLAELTQRLGAASAEALTTETESHAYGVWYNDPYTNAVQERPAACCRHFVLLLHVSSGRPVVG